MFVNNLQDSPELDGCEEALRILIYKGEALDVSPVNVYVAVSVFEIFIPRYVEVATLEVECQWHGHLHGEWHRVSCFTHIEGKSSVKVSPGQEDA
jgi:hypothetical protein